MSVSLLADSIVDSAMTYLGTPYRSGAKGADHFDCSGFTGYIYKLFGYELQSSSLAQFKEGKTIDPKHYEFQKGDLLFFEGRQHNKRVGHVGIYIGKQTAGGGIQFIHAAVDGGVIISDTKEPYYASRYMGAKRMIPDINPPRDTMALASALVADGISETHTIQSGDTLYSIARRYGTTVDALCELNGITPKTILRVGREIKVK